MFFMAWFPIYIFGALAGFTGLIIAVPLAAIIGVLCRFFTKKYLESKFYR